LSANRQAGDTKSSRAVVQEEAARSWQVRNNITGSQAREGSSTR
jgi:hypothetical protein